MNKKVVRSNEYNNKYNNNSKSNEGSFINEYRDKNNRTCDKERQKRNIYEPSNSNQKYNNNNDFRNRNKERSNYR